MFTDALSTYIDQFGDHRDDPDFTRVFDPSRIEEAMTVSTCVERYVDSELTDPDNPTGIIRIKHLDVPKLGYVLRNKLDDLSAEKLEALKWEIYRSIALGYFTQVQAECPAVIHWEYEPPEVRVGRGADEIWETWTDIVYFADDSLGLNEGSYGELIDVARKLGGDVLYDGLRKTGLVPRFRKGAKISRIGYWYSTAGVALRYVQSTLFSDSDFLERIKPARP